MQRRMTHAGFAAGHGGRTGPTNHGSHRRQVVGARKQRCRPAVAAFCVRRIDRGATGWKYFAPYQADVEAVLQKLRADVFERGEYGQTQGIPPEVLATMPPEIRVVMEKLRDLEAHRLGGLRESSAALMSFWKLRQRMGRTQFWIFSALL